MTAARWKTFLLPAFILALGLSFGLIPLVRGKIFFFNDNTDEYFPHTKFLVQALKAGAIPQWWSEVGSGLLVVVEGEAHYSPLRLMLAATLSAPAAYMCEISLWFALAGLGTYLFLRRIELHPLAAMAGSLGFMFGSQLVVYVRSMGLLRAACFLPWAMWLVETSFHRKKSALVFSLAPVVIGLQFLSGNPTFAVVTVVAIFCYLFLRSALLVLVQDMPATAALRIVAMWVLILALGVGIGGVQVIPTLQHLNQSVRAGGLSFQYVASTSHSQIKDFPQSFFPYVYSLDSAVTAAAGFYDGALLAAGVLFCLWRIRRAGAPARCLAVGALLGMLLSLGASTPLYGLLFRLPVFGSLRFPLRYQFWASFCFASIGAIGLNQAIEMKAKASGFRRFAPAAIALLLLTAAVWRLRPERPAELALSALFLFVSMGLLVAVSVAPRPLVIGILSVANLFLLADLSYFRIRANYAPSVSIAEALRNDGMVRWLTPDTSRFRIFSLLDEHSLPLGQQNILTGSSPTLWNLETIGYHGSLELRRYQKVLDGLTKSFLSGAGAAKQLTGFLGFLQAKYVIAPRELVLDGWDKVIEGAVAVWRNPEFHEREFLVGRVQNENAGRERFPGDEEFFDEVRSSSIDFRQVAVIAADQLPPLDGLGERAEVRRLPSPYDAMDFQVSSDRPALLVIPSNYYPGWTAAVNGASARIYRANWIGMGVLVNPGESRVALRFVQPGFRAGLLLSLAAVVSWAGIALWLYRRSRQMAP